MDLKNVEIIEYSKKVDLWNFLTHALGVVLSFIAIPFLLRKANGTRETVSALIYGLSLLAVYTVSSLYHKLKIGEAKRKARLLDHSTVPLLIAGTATPCALVTLFNISVPHSILVFSLGWFCAVFGIISKVFFFERLKAVTMAVYIISGAVMLLSVVPIIEKVDLQGFRMLLFGCIFYVVGAVLLGLGKKYEILHPIFHVFVLAGSAFHFFAIYLFVY